MYSENPFDAGWAKPVIDGINEALGTDIALVFSVPAVVLVY